MSVTFCSRSNSNLILNLCAYAACYVSWNDDLTEFAQNLTAAEKRILEEGNTTATLCLC